MRFYERTFRRTVYLRRRIFRSKTALDAGKDDVGEKGDLRTDKRGRQGNGDQHCQNFWHEGQGHFLNLGQGLDEGDDDTDDHSGNNGRAGSDDHCPDRRLHDIEGIRLIHWLSLYGNTRAYDKFLAGIEHRDDSIRV